MEVRKGPLSLEEEQIYAYLQRAGREVQLEAHEDAELASCGLIMVEGFEERSIGILRGLARRGIQLRALVVGRYSANVELNSRFRPELEALCKQVAVKAHARLIDIDDNDRWIRAALASCEAKKIIVDISAVSHKGMFPLLDAVSEDSRQIMLGYSEADAYWPTRGEWESLRKSLKDGLKIAEVVDEKPWLFGCQHTVAHVPRHEGYGGIARGRALIAFLPYKCARLGAILGEDTYSEFIFIAGKPRLRRNQWRVKALKEINAPLIGSRPVVTIPTFDYRRCVNKMVALIFQGETPVQKYDLHLAVLGSKLQTVSCWIIARYLRSLSVMTSTPDEYYPEAFSDGVGSSWLFDSGFSSARG